MPPWMNASVDVDFKVAKTIAKISDACEETMIPPRKAVKCPRHTSKMTSNRILTLSILVAHRSTRVFEGFLTVSSTAWAKVPQMHTVLYEDSRHKRNTP